MTDAWKWPGGKTAAEVYLGVGWLDRFKANTESSIKHDLRTFDSEASKLYYAGFVKFAEIVNNRGGTRKEEKHMGVRKFKSMYGKSIMVSDGFGDATIEVGGSPAAIIKHADMPLIAHALFEKSGWPDAVKDDVGDWGVEAARNDKRWGFKVVNEREADIALATAIANLAAYNAWAEGTAEREAAEAAKKAEAEAAARKKREHDELRTSAIALEALALYNAWYAGSTGSSPYESWSAVNAGDGCTDEKVRHWIAKAEAARAAKPAPKVGDRVRVSADAGVLGRPRSFFGGEVEGSVIGVDSYDGVLHIKAPTSEHPLGKKQYVDPKCVTVVATAEDLAAEKAKAERDAGIVDLSCVMGISRRDAEIHYNRGIRATA